MVVECKQLAQLQGDLLPWFKLQVQDWDIAAMFSATRPARRKAAAATSEPAAAFQALLETAPSLPSSPFTLQCSKSHTKSVSHQQCQLQPHAVGLQVEHTLWSPTAALTVFILYAAHEQSPLQQF